MQQGMSNKEGERNTLVHSGVFVGYHVVNGKRNTNDRVHTCTMSSLSHTHTLSPSISLSCVVAPYGHRTWIKFHAAGNTIPYQKNDRCLSARCVCECVCVYRILEKSMQ